MYIGHMDKAKWGKDWGWEVGVSRVGESADGKMKITLLEQQKKKGKKLKRKKREK